MLRHSNRHYKAPQDNYQPLPHFFTQLSTLFFLTTNFTNFTNFFYAGQHFTNASKDATNYTRSTLVALLAKNWLRSQNS
jgi:hypothetical protein